MALSPQELADRAEIMDVLIRYAQAIDTKQFDLLADVFTPDAHVDYTTSGGIEGSYPEIRVWLEKALTPFPTYLHALSNTTYRFEGESAHTQTYFVNPMAYPVANGLHTFTVYGYYIDRLARTADGWRIAERTEEQCLMEGTLPPNFEIPT